MRTSVTKSKYLQSSSSTKSHRFPSLPKTTTSHPPSRRTMENPCNDSAYTSSSLASSYEYHQSPSSGAHAYTSSDTTCSFSTIGSTKRSSSESREGSRSPQVQRRHQRTSESLDRLRASRTFASAALDDYDYDGALDYGSFVSGATSSVRHHSRTPSLSRFGDDSDVEMTSSLGTTTNDGKSTGGGAVSRPRFRRHHHHGYSSDANDYFSVRPSSSIKRYRAARVSPGGAGEWSPSDLLTKRPFSYQVHHYSPSTNASVVRSPSPGSATAGGREEYLIGGWQGVPQDDYALNLATNDSPENFKPTHVRVTVLPSGKEAVTYTQAMQKGHGDQRLASLAIDNVTEKTKHLLESMSPLEKFVRLNRHLFPEETLLYQQVTFSELTDEELRRIGEAPGTILYTVKIREKLVVPRGTEIAEIINRHFGKNSDIDIEYSGGGRPRSRYDIEEPELDYRSMYDLNRRKVEEEYDRRDRDQVPVYKRSSREDWEPERRPKRAPDLQTPSTSNRGFMSVPTGFDNDSMYGTPRSRRSSFGSITSDQESTVTKSSAPESARRKRKTFGQEPHFTAKLRPKRCTEGQPVRFNCSVSGLPLPAITWFKGNTPLTEGGRYHCVNNYGLASLEISGIKREDAGLYTVKATNPDGEAQCSAQLEVQEIETDAERKTAEKRPWFIIEPQNSWIEVGQKAIFEAQATGRPMPSFKWQKDNVDLEPNSRIRVFSDDFGNSKLVIADLVHGDVGHYTCIAENVAGRTRGSATLRVVDRGQIIDVEKRRSVSREPTPIRRFLVSRENTPRIDIKPRTGKKPWFVQLPPAEVTIHEGDVMTLTCVTDGDPKPRVIWQKGTSRDLIYSKRHRVLVGGNHHLMEITSTVQTDPGQYIIIAENEFGRVQASTFVNMLPRREKEPEEFEIKRHQYEIPDYDVEVTRHKETGKMPPRFIRRLPLTTEVKLGSDICVKCFVKEGKPPEYITGVDVRVIRRPDKGTAPAANKPDVVSVAPEAENRGVPSGQANLPSGISSYESPSVPSRISAAAPTGPDVPSGVSSPNKEVLTPVPNANEKPSKKDSTIVPEIPSVSAEPAALRSTKVPPGAVTVPAAGNELEQASRPVSEPSDRETAPAAPKFVTPLKDKTAKVHGGVKLSAKIKSKAPTTVKWYKDDQEIEEVSGRFDIYFDAGEFHCEIYDVELGDTGTYKCVATNDSGKASSASFVAIVPTNDEAVKIAPPESQSIIPAETTSPKAKKKRVQIADNEPTAIPPSSETDGKQAQKNKDKDTAGIAEPMPTETNPVDEVGMNGPSVEKEEVAIRPSIERQQSPNTIVIPEIEITLSEDEPVEDEEGEKKEEEDEEEEEEEEPAAQKKRKDATKRDGEPAGEAKPRKPAREVDDRKKPRGSGDEAAPMEIGAKEDDIVEIVVIEQGSGAAPTFVGSTIENTTVRGGASVDFRCEATGIPLPSLTWTKDNIEVQPSPTTKMRSEGAVHFLIISSVRKQDAGEYACTAMNPFGTATDRAMLKVEDENKDENASEEEISSEEERLVDDLRVEVPLEVKAAGGPTKAEAGEGKEEAEFDESSEEESSEESDD